MRRRSTDGMARMLYSEQARFALQGLPAEILQEIERRIDYVGAMPRMYAVTTDERFPGCRSFRIDAGYRVFYMVAAGGRDVYVVAVLPEELDEPPNAESPEP